MVTVCEFRQHQNMSQRTTGDKLGSRGHCRLPRANSGISPEVEDKSIRLSDLRKVLVPQRLISRRISYQPALLLVLCRDPRCLEIVEFANEVP